MADRGKRLLGLAGLGTKGDDEEETSGEPSEKEPKEEDSPGKVAAMEDFHAAHKEGDAEGMSKALGAWHTVHASEKTRGGADAR